MAGVSVMCDTDVKGRALSARSNENVSRETSPLVGEENGQRKKGVFHVKHRRTISNMTRREGIALCSIR
jgi:hypothetical protein